MWVSVLLICTGNRDNFLNFKFSVDKFVFSGQLCTGLFFDSQGPDGIGAPVLQCSGWRAGWRDTEFVAARTRIRYSNRVDALVPGSSSYKICSVLAHSSLAGFLRGHCLPGTDQSIGDFS